MLRIRFSSSIFSADSNLATWYRCGSAPSLKVLYHLLQASRVERAPNRIAHGLESPVSRTRLAPLTES